MGVAGISTQPGRSLSDTGPLVMLVLASGTLSGGFYFYRYGWRKGHDFANVMAVLPAAVLIVLFAIGALYRATNPSPDDLSQVFASASEYRTVSASVWADYADPAVTAESWVRTVDENMPTMQAAVDAVDAEVATIQDDELRAEMQAFTVLLADELGIMVDLRNAVASGNREAELAAHRRLAELERERARVTQLLLSKDGAPGS